MSKSRSWAARLRALAVVVAMGTITIAVGAEPAAAEPPPVYEPPVSVPVVDGFRPPAHAFGPGNRGLEYGTAPGAEVRAAADGRVVFAGPVAGSRHVTLLHDDGLRTTYSYLHQIDVLVGQIVRRGDLVGLTGGHLHFSARVGDAYLDPALLFAAGPPQVHLVPFDVPPGVGIGGERSAITQLIGGIGNALGGALDGVAGAAIDAGEAGAAWLRGTGAQLLRTAVHYAPLVIPIVGLIVNSGRLADAARIAWDIAHRACTDRGTVVRPPSGRRVALLVAGLGSTSEGGSIDDVDVGALGYDVDDVTRFSYAGGRTPTTGRSFSSIDATTYSKDESQGDLFVAGRRLADLVEEVVAEAPGVPVDVYAHSQGGVVARLALLELEARHGTAWLERFGLVATLGTPHQGADLATAGFAVLEGSAVGTLLEASGVDDYLPYDPGAPTARQLSETSDLVRVLRDGGIPEPIDLVSIAARGDIIVASPRTVVDGATQVVVPIVSPTAHADLPGSGAAQRELALALAGAPPTCQSFGAALLDQLVGEGISAAEDAVGLRAWAGARWLTRVGGR